MRMKTAAVLDIGCNRSGRDEPQHWIQAPARAN